MTERRFPRTFAALQEVFAFTREFFDGEGVPAEHRFAVDFAVEEIFTNMVKYQPGALEGILVGLERRDDLLTVVLADRGVEPFDPTRARETRIDAPLEERRPGGLGIQLTKKLMDAVEYSYDDRTSTVTLTKNLGTGDVRDQAR